MKPLLYLLCLWSLSSAVCAQGLTAPGKHAYDALAHVSTFAVGGVGFAGTRSAGESALRVLLKEKGANAAFQKLLQSATPEGQLYGLLGLSLVAPGQLTSYAKAYLSSKSPVQTISGCIVMTETTGQVTQQINKGRYRAYFARPEVEPQPRSPVHAGRGR